MAEESNTIIGALTKIANNLRAVQVHVTCEFPPDVKDQLSQIASALQALVALQGGGDSQPEIDV
jgi:hypothetical protein